MNKTALLISIGLLMIASLAGCGGDSAEPGAVVKKQLWTCSMHPQVIQDHPGECPICGMDLEPVSQSQSDDAHGGVRIDPVMVQNMGVRTAMVRQIAMSRTVRASAMIREAEPNVHEISLRISGWIERLYANTQGMRITKGDALFELYSPELQVAIEELIAAQKSPTNPMRNQMLDAARRKLALWGVDAAQIDELANMDNAPRTVAFRSPASGIVTDKSMFEGSYVEAGASVLRIADRSMLWLDAQIYTQDIALIDLGQTVQARVETATKPIEGKVTFIAPTVDSATRTTAVRIELPNDEFQTLRPGMFASVSIVAPIAEQALAIPRSAVIDTGARQVVFVAMDDAGHFEPREVKTGDSDDEGNVQLLAGVKAGETVVTSGQFLLDSESRLREALAKYQSDSLQTPATGHQH